VVSIRILARLLAHASQAVPAVGLAAGRLAGPVIDDLDQDFACAAADGDVGGGLPVHA
jgi:hypothetical protein